MPGSLTSRNSILTLWDRSVRLVKLFYEPAKRSVNFYLNAVQQIQRPSTHKKNERRPGGREARSKLFGSALRVRMHPNIRRDLARLCQLDHVHRQMRSGLSGALLDRCPLQPHWFHLMAT